MISTADLEKEVEAELNSIQERFSGRMSPPAVGAVVQVLMLLALQRIPAELVHDLVTVLYKFEDLVQLQKNQTLS